MKTGIIYCAFLILLAFASCGPDSPYSRDMDRRLLDLQQQEAQEADALYQATLRRGPDPKLSAEMNQRLLDDQRERAETTAAVYRETLRRVKDHSATPNHK
jgi:hypothetical protein